MIAHALFNSEPLDADKMYAEYAQAAEKIAPFVCDTAVLLNEALDRRRVGAVRGRARARCSTSITAPILL